MDQRPSLSLFLGPILGLVCYFGLLSAGIEKNICILSALSVQTLVWWFAESVSPPVAGLIFATLASLFKIAPTDKIFSYFANPIIYFFLGGFFLAKALEVHNVAEKILHSLDRAPWMAGHPYRISAVMILLTAVLSAFLNNTATAALVLPFAVSLAKKEFSSDQKATVHLILGVAYAASLGGMLTVFGTAPNLIAVGILKETVGESIDFMDWMKFALPLGLPLIAILFFRSLWLGRSFQVSKDSSRLAHVAPRFSKGAKRSLFLLLVSMLLLMATSLVPSFSFVGETQAILLPALLLFILPSGSRSAPLLTWKEAKEIDWGCLILFGSGLCMGGLMFSTGLAKLFGSTLKIVGEHPTLFLAALILFVLVITEFASNTASVTLLVPLALAVAKESGLPMESTVHVVALTASLGLMLPVGTPPNALAYGTGLVSTKNMIRNGVLLDVVGALLCFVIFKSIF